MSGQPNRNPMDASKYREQYLANLNLQATLNDKNYQANNLYKKTGTTPSQLTDTRTTAEKLADIERLKIDLRSQLSQIADGQQSQAIVEGLSDDQLTFLAQHIDEIVKDIKPKYKLGVPADIFIPYLEKYMEKADLTNEVNFGLQQSKGSEILLGVQQILGDMISQPVIDQLRRDLDTDRGVMALGLQTALHRDLQYIEQLIPSRQFLQNLNSIQDAITRANLQETLSAALNPMPTASQILPYLRRLEIAYKANDKAEVDNIGTQLHSLLTIDPATKTEIQEIIKDVSQELHLSRRTKLATPTGKSGLTQNEIDNIRALIITSSSLSSKGEFLNYIKEMKDYLKPVKSFTNTELGISGKITNANVDILQKATKVLNDFAEPYVFVGGAALPPYTKAGGTGKGISGCGIAKPTPQLKKTYPTKPIEIDYSVGILPKQKYVPFGRYFIDSNRLNDNVVSIRRANGVNICGLPVKLVSKNLGEVIRVILGKGLPQYHQLDKLDDDEKIYLHKLAKTTDLLDRISIPTPKKSDADKDFNRFEILKGQILSGNDNKELIKEFKILLMKLANNKILPKPQVREMLFDLTTMGF